MTEPSGEIVLSLSDIMLIGENLHYLQNLAVTNSPEEALERIDLLLQSLAQLQLAESDQTARDWFFPIQRAFDDQLGKDPITKLENIIEEIRDTAADLVEIVREEASQRSAFVVPFDQERYAEGLLSDTEAFFKVDLGQYSASLNHAIHDLEEATRCYAIGRPAAAIVFSLRGTEAFIRQFYYEVTGQEPSKGATWGRLMNVINLPVLACDNSVPSELGMLLKQQ